MSYLHKRWEQMYICKQKLPYNDESYSMITIGRIFKENNK